MSPEVEILDNISLIAAGGSAGSDTGEAGTPPKRCHSHSGTSSQPLES